MSLSNPQVSISSPIKRYYKWNGSDGTLKYYDVEKSEIFPVTKPFKFILTDEFSLVAGYSAKVGSGFRSNEVKSTAKEPLTVKWNSGKILCEGLYTDIKEKVELNGGKYHKSLYGVTEIGGQLELINLQLKGAGMSAWLNFDKSTTMKLEGLEILVGKSDEMKTGNVTYFQPVFKAKKPTEADLLKATEKDSELQEYFKVRTTNEITPVEELTDEEKGQLRSPKVSVVKAKKTGGFVDADFEDFDEEEFFS